MAAATKVDPIDRREQAAEMLADGKTITEIAAALNVDRTNVWRWLKRPEVADHYLSCVNTRAGRLTQAATDWMEKAFDDPDMPAAVKVAVARLAFERADKLQAVKDRVIGNDDTESDKTTKVPANPWAFLKKAE